MDASRRLSVRGDSLPSKHANVGSHVAIPIGVDLALSEEPRVSRFPIGLEVFAEKGGHFIRYSDDLVGCLPVELEIELSLRSAVFPIGEMLELVAP